MDVKVQECPSHPRAIGLSAGEASRASVNDAFELGVGIGLVTGICVGAIVAGIIWFGATWIGPLWLVLLAVTLGSLWLAVLGMLRSVT